MSDRLLKESDVLRIAFQLPYVINSNFFDAVKSLPSADKPQGEWEIYVISPFDGEDCRCSECGQTGCAPYWDYCPNCGARMKGADDE